MSYTIVGMFPNNEDLMRVEGELQSAGFPIEDYRISRYSTTSLDDRYGSTQFKEDKKTSGFWSWLFGDNEDDRNKYSYAGTKSNIVTVYANDMQRAEQAKEIMNKEGAININEFTKERYPETTAGNHDLSEAERAKIISKAKNSLYFTDATRFYDTPGDGMESDMDSEGSRSTF